MSDSAINGAVPTDEDIPWPADPADPRGGYPAPRGDDDEATTWEPVNLGPYLRGEVKRPRPSIGIRRTDGLRLCYPGREHSVVGETESGKTWFGLGCVAEELLAGNFVVYIHYEENDPASTIERLLLLGVDPGVITAFLRFIAPSRAARIEWVDALLDPVPTLVIHDGVNEAMSLMGADIMAADGASAFRRRLVAPFLRVGAASIACDHFAKDRDGRGRDAYGSVHKGNALDGARIVLENETPFGRGLRGVSHVFVTKDRPGHLRAHGRPTKLPGKTYIGTLVVDDSETVSPDFSMRFFAPNSDDPTPAGHDPDGAVADDVHAVIAALPARTAPSLRRLYAALRNAGHQIRDEKARDVLEDLILAGRLIEVTGKRGARGYQAVLPIGKPSQDPTASRDRVPASPLRGVGRSRTQSQTTVAESVGRNGTQSQEVGDVEKSSLPSIPKVVTDQLGAKPVDQTSGGGDDAA